MRGCTTAGSRRRWLMEALERRLLLSSPDLRVAEVTAPDAWSGHTYEWSVTVENVGDAGTGDGTYVWIQVYVSDDTVLDASDALLASYNTDQLVAGASLRWNLQRPFPSGMSGDKYLIAIADWNGTSGAVAESDESNNTAYAAVRVDPETSQPDLKVTAVTAPDGTAGSFVDVSVTVENAGTASTGKRFRTTCWLSGDQAWDSGDTLIGEWDTGLLAAGASATGLVSCALPPTASGAQYVVVYTDWVAGPGSIPESDETNNTAADALFVAATTERPDLTVASLTVPEARAGETALVAVAIENVGNVVSGADTHVAFYLSSDPTWDAGDRFLYTFNGTQIAAHSTALFTSVPVAIPADAEGALYIIAYADWNGSTGFILEESETNNTRAEAVSIGSARPDLTVVDLEALDGWEGHEYRCKVHVRNIGSAAVLVPYPVRVYVSDDAILDPGDALVAAGTFPAFSGSEPYVMALAGTLPVGYSGDKYLIGYADWDGSGGVIDEAIESNNTGADPVHIDPVSGQPDLEIVSVSAPDAQAGETISVSTGVRNSGSAAVGTAWSLSWYLSDDAAYDAGDTLLLTDAYDSMPAGATWNLSRSLPLPSGVAGTKYILALADWDGAAGTIPESNENNNTGADALSILALAPDLRVAAFAAPDGVVGLPMHLTATIENAGGAGAGSGARVGYYFSHDDVWDASDILWHESDIPALGAGASAGVAEDMTPGAAVVGYEYMIAVADWQGVISESDETNNWRADAVTISEPAAGPDLDMTALVAPDGVEGRDLAVQATVRNTGTVSTGSSFPISFYLSADTVWDASDTLLGTVSHPALDAGELHTFDATVPLPAGVTGIKYVIAYADWQLGVGTIAETDESNNTISDAVYIVVRPDLLITSLSAPDGTAGESISVPTTLANQANGNADDDIGVGYYLSSDAVWDAADIFLGRIARAPLAADTSDIFTAIVPLPAGVTGSMYLIAFADDQGLIGEADETNNTRAAALTIAPGAPPDLVVTALEVGDVVSGQPLDVTLTVQNTGGQDAGAFYVGYYFGENDTLTGNYVFWDQTSIAGLAPGASAQVTAALATSPALTGFSYLIARADSTGTVAESDEANNDRAVAVDLSGSAPVLIGHIPAGTVDIWFYDVTPDNLMPFNSSDYKIIGSGKGDGVIKSFEFRSDMTGLGVLITGTQGSVGKVLTGRGAFGDLAFFVSTIETGQIKFGDGVHILGTNLNGVSLAGTSGPVYTFAADIDGDGRTDDPLAVMLSAPASGMSLFEARGSVEADVVITGDVKTFKTPWLAGDLRLHSSLKSFTADHVADGSVIAVEGPLGTLKAGDWPDGTLLAQEANSIQIGQATAVDVVVSPGSVAKLAFKDDYSGSVTIGDTLKAMSVGRTFGGALTAQDLGTLTVGGAFSGASVNIDSPLAAKGNAKSIKIGMGLTGQISVGHALKTLSVTGDVGVLGGGRTTIGVGQELKALSAKSGGLYATTVSAASLKSASFKGAYEMNDSTFQVTNLGTLSLGYRVRASDILAASMGTVSIAGEIESSRILSDGQLKSVSVKGSIVGTEGQVVRIEAHGAAFTVGAHNLKRVKLDPGDPTITRTDDGQPTSITCSP